MEEIIKIIVLLILLIVVVFIAAFILSVITKFGALLFVGLLVYVIMKRKWGILPWNTLKLSMQ